MRQIVTKAIFLFHFILSRNITKMPHYSKTSLHVVTLQETGEYCQVGGYHSDTHDCRGRVGDEWGLL